MKNILVVLTLFTASCACFNDEAKKNTPGCIVLHDLIDCTVGAVKEHIPYFAQIVGNLISGGMSTDQIPWDEIAKQAEAMGIKDGICFLSELKNLIFANTKMKSSVDYSRKMTAIGDALDAYKLKHFGTRAVRVRIIDRETGKAVDL